jgi:bacillithiol biosynthesis deacetylase BshB1
LNADFFMKLHILAIGAHPDDTELGCSGTLINHIRKGQKAGIIDLTEGELGTRGSVTTRYAEAKASAVLQQVSIRQNLQMADGFFQHNPENILKLVKVIRQYRPEIVLANALEDRHPDHGRAGRLIADACFLSGLIKVESVDSAGEAQQAWRPKKVFHYIQDRFLEPDLIVDISESFDLKMQAIQSFSSQFFSNTDSPEPETYISTPGFLQKTINRAEQLGHRIGVKYGEGFCIETKLGVTDLDQIIYPEFV